MLVRARTRSVGRLKLSLIHIRRDKRRLVTGWAQPEMHDVRTQSRMPHERRVKLKRQIRSGDRRMDRQDVRTRPRARRLALSRRAIDRQIEINPRSRVHGLHGTASVCRLGWRRSRLIRSDRGTRAVTRASRSGERAIDAFASPPIRAIRGSCEPRQQSWPGGKGGLAALVLKRLRNG